METELIIEGGGFPPFSARGCIQELSLIPLGQMRRTVNGELMYVGPSRVKYYSTIQCEDKSVLVHEGILMRGSVVKIGCIQRIWQNVETNDFKLERDAVEGSVAAIDANRKTLSVNMKTTCEGFIKDECHQAFVSYRPWLYMRVLNVTLHTNEWGLKSGWKVELEEV